MSKKQKIRWSKPVGCEEKTLYELFGSVSAWSGMLLDAVCAFIYIYAARLMMDDVFMFGTPDVGHIISLSLTAIFISLSMQVAKCFGRRRIRYSIYIGIFVLGLVLSWLGATAMSSWQELGFGFQKIADTYIGFWNEYYGSSYYVPMFVTDVNILMAPPDTHTVVSGALDYVSFVFMYFCLWESKLRGRHNSLLVMPLLAFIAELLVGYTPKQTSLFLVLVAILVGNAHRWTEVSFMRARGSRTSILNLESKKMTGVVASVGKMVSHFKWAILGICIWIMCMCTATFGTISASHVIDNADEFYTAVRDFIEDIRDEEFPNADNNDDIIPPAPSLPPTQSELTNDTPVYTGRTIMMVTTQDKFNGALYMKGFQANSYEDGVWTEDLEPLYQGLEDINYDSDSFARELAYLSYDSIIGYYNASGIPVDNWSTAMLINYVGQLDKRAYIPYFSQVIDDNIATTGEGLFEKKASATSISFNAWIYSGIYATSMVIGEDTYRYDWEDWYNTFVRENYASVPSELLDVVFNVIEDIYNSGYDDFLVWDEDSVNVYRINQAINVAKWLTDNTTYSLNLPEVSAGVDPIQYFLEDSRTGYCMHYASAATMILRGMGVPARYATGYILAEDALKRQDDVYKASVKDNMAHAWVEIYLEDIGWVPVEVTLGYSENPFQGEEDSDTSNPSTEPTSDDTTTKEQQSQEATTDESTSEKDTTEDETTTDAESKTEDTTGDGEGSGDKHSDSSDNNLLQTMKIVLPVVIIVSVAGFIAYNIYRNHAIYMAKLQADITNQRTRIVIRKINRRMYKRLRRMGRVLKLSITDDEYSKILKKTYSHIESSDWNRYMNIVKAAAFSTVDFTVEEMEFCLKMYDMVKGVKENTSP